MENSMNFWKLLCSRACVHTNTEAFKSITEQSFFKAFLINWMQNLGTSCFATSWAKLCINDIFFPEEPSKNKFVCITYQSVYLPLKKKKKNKSWIIFFFNLIWSLTIKCSWIYVWLWGGKRTEKMWSKEADIKQSSLLKCWMYFTFKYHFSVNLYI